MHPSSHVHLWAFLTPQPSEALWCSGSPTPCMDGVGWQLQKHWGWGNRGELFIIFKDFMKYFRSFRAKMTAFLVEAVILKS